MRKVYLFIFFLMIICGAIIYGQWHTYKNVAVSNKSAQNVDNLIVNHFKLEHLKTVMHVTQMVGNLHLTHYNLNLPKNMDHFSCLTEQSRSCTMGKGKTQLVLKNKENSVTFGYDIPVSSNGSSLFTNWFIKMQPEGKSTAKIELVEGSDKNSEWIIDAKRVAFEKRKLIHFYKWEKNDLNTLPLYYSNVPYIYQNQLQLFHYYREQSVPIRDLVSLKELGDLPGYPTMTVIDTKNKKEYISPSFIILNKHSILQTIKEKLTYSYVKEKLPILASKEKWMWDVMTSLLMGKEYGSENAVLMEKQLFAQLTPEEIKQFTNLVLQQHQKNVTPLVLNHNLAKVIKGYSTTYFSEKHSNLYFVDAKHKLIANGKEVNGHVLYTNKQLYIPLESVLTGFGFVINKGEKALLVKENHETWKLYLYNHYFVLNGQEYGLYKNPFLLIHQQIYLPVDWLNRLFAIKVLNQGDAYIFIK